jgi:hypothetical protein
MGGAALEAEGKGRRLKAKVDRHGYAQAEGAAIAAAGSGLDWLTTKSIGTTPSGERMKLSGRASKMVIASALRCQP